MELGNIAISYTTGAADLARAVCSVHGRALNSVALARILERQRQYMAHQKPQQAPRAFAEEVSALLKELPSLYGVAEANIAQVLSMSRSSLVRFLHSEGTGFRALLSHERCRRYRELSGAGVTRIELLYQLGYSSSSSLYRARKRWQQSCEIEP